ncbi:hypothetical protein ACJJIK_13565 [Microbulbifer sp. ZKSA006]|uniref:hypothetical protein n=1 Tax=Microbulbifer sp. ZKSA006 TaxID=3243390 RepID=UPI004039E1DB
MNSQRSGAKAARKEIDKFHLLLNHDAMIPAQCYRMSDNLYGLVCYTNQVVALFISRNFEMIPIFINRAYKQLQRFDSQSGVAGYRNLVFDYFCQVTHYLDRYCNLDDDWFKDRIPTQILIEGEKKAPEYDHEKMFIKLPDNWRIDR